MAELGRENQERLEHMTGYSLDRDGNDWVVRDSDPSLQAPSSDVLTFHPDGLPLASRTFQQVADVCMEFLHAELESKGIQPPRSVNVSSNLGLISRLEKIRSLYFWEPASTLKRRLVEDILPRMTELGAKRVFPATVNSDIYYPRIALPKISYLTRRHGLEIAREKIANSRILDAAIPSPIEPLDSLEAALFVAPYAFALPLRRAGSCLLFTPQRAWQFPPILCGNVFGQIGASPEPFETHRVTFLFGEQDVSSRLMRSILRIEVESLNKLIRFFTHPLNFLGDNGEFDELRLLKANSLVKLMIADVRAINMTDSYHTKSRLTFQFFDKIANLIVEMNNPQLERRNSAEKAAADRFYSFQVFDELKTVLGYHGRQKDRELGKFLLKVVSRVETSIQEEVRAVFKKANEPLTDTSVHQYFRILRNLGHGTFLHRDQFEELFLRFNPVIPSEYSYLPWMVMLALGLAPERILGLRVSSA